MEPDKRAASLKRRESWADLQTKWLDRTGLAAKWLQDDPVVLDVGCGLMTLEAYLPKSTKYMPLDVVARDHRTIVLDLDQEPIPRVSCNALVMLGVLEYTSDLSMILNQLRHFPKCVLSYNHRSVNDLLWKFGLRPKRVTWRHRYSRSCFRRKISRAGLRITREQRVRVGERLYEVRPSDKMIN